MDGHETRRSSHRPIFFEDENGDAVTVNQERYVQQALVPFSEKLGEKVGADRPEEWFQQDGATPHTAQKSLQWLKEKFDKRLISLKTDVEWSPNFTDLSPLDFFLWGYMKDRVYAHKPRSTHELKEAIRSEATSQADPTADDRQRSDTSGDRAPAHGAAAQGFPSRAPPLRRDDCGASHVTCVVLPCHKE